MENTATDIVTLDRAPLESCPRGVPAWIQRNLQLRGDTGRQKHESARLVFDALLALIEENEGAIRRMFFQRKPPDLRLRIQASPERRVAKRVDAMLGAHSNKGGPIVSVYPSVYEPERRRFGGRAAMKAAHRFFHDDTLLWLGLDGLDRKRQGTVPRDIFVLGVINELLLIALRDPAEVWDVWCRYVEATRLPKCSAVYPPLRAEDWIPFASAPELELATGYRSASRRLVAALERAEIRGRMRVGKRAFLARLLLFTLNRHGFDHDWQARMGHGMVEAWAPSA
jgi:thiopeptide-type bacteriocin biosynthesis protein